MSETGKSFNVLSLATVGTFGTYVAGWVLGLMISGVDYQTAGVTAIVTQLITLAFAALIDIAAWWVTITARKTRRTRIRPTADLEEKW